MKTLDQVAPEELDDQYLPADLTDNGWRRAVKAPPYVRLSPEEVVTVSADLGKASALGGGLGALIGCATLLLVARIAFVLGLGQFGSTAIWPVFIAGAVGGGTAGAMVGGMRRMSSLELIDGRQSD
jgi:hypothetical protein